MKEIRYTITDPVGLHARPAGSFVKAVQALKCGVTVSDGTHDVDAKRLLAVMGLDVNCGDTITLCLEGDGEDGAALLLESYLKNNL